jgi:hypothetical protein
MRSEATTGRHFDPEQGETAAGRAILDRMSAKNRFHPGASDRIRAGGVSETTGRITGR